jgi:hypothetical protein
MKPARFPSLGLRDPALLQSSGFTPDPADATMWGWWSGNDYFTPLGAPGSGGNENTIKCWGDISNNTANKTGVTNTRNLVYQPGGSGSWYPAIMSEANGQSNLCVRSETFGNAYSEWAGSNITKNDDTHFTFTAQNGYIRQPIFATYPGRTYRLTIRCRAVTGNTALKLYHLNSATGNTTSITVTGTLADYTVDILGPATTGTLHVGLQDTNAAGFGQVEITRAHLVDTGYCSDTSYLKNGDYIPKFPAIAAKRNFVVVPLNYGYVYNPLTSGGTITASVCTIYACAMIQDHIRAGGGGGWMFASVTPNWGCAQLIDAPSTYNMYSNGNGVRIALGSTPSLHTKYIFTHVWNGANSKYRLNKGAQASGAQNWGGNITNGFSFGGAVFPMVAGPPSMWFEMIIFTTAHDTATQDQYIDYLASRYSVTV